MKKKEEEEKDNDEWVSSVILIEIGLGVQNWVLLLELKKKIEFQEIGRAPKLEVGAL